ncbi:hypothetical protein NPA08_04020 [Mycoplasmopsis citelli]|uniref:hypothetical protein n=1 Tax=Mycoplasmopsis citelli TaxID=171281 RepID=UPI002114F676|nr:hypothetical protein [Mycoplasmopsis citelli]UUD36092.1 hypothetical protein NPA08_04020 [Mycoplasmopsis citelli]
MNPYLTTYVLFAGTFIILCIKAIFRILYMYFTSMKIDAFLYSITMEKIKFCLYHKIQVHSFFIKGINSLCKNLKIRNIQVIYQKIPALVLMETILVFLVWFTWVSLPPYGSSFSVISYITTWEFMKYLFNLILLILSILVSIQIFWWIIFIFYKRNQIKKISKLSQDLQISGEDNLFGLTLTPKEILFLEQKGSVKNFVNYVKNQNLFLRFSTFYHNILNWSIDDLQKIYKEDIFWSRDILIDYSNGNKDDARFIHYLLIVYSNYLGEHFYNSDYQDNMRFFIELEKYYQD